MSTIAITGANRGIGLALVRTYLRRGDAVIAMARHPAQATALAALKHAGGKLELHALDVADEGQSRALGAALAGRPIDVVICNAGIMSSRGGIEDAGHDAAEWLRVMATNVVGPWLTTRALLPCMDRAKAAGGTPKLAVISSMMGSSATSNGAAYGYRASKAAAANLGLNLSIELKRRGIAVGIYHPGYVATDMSGPAAPVSPDASAAGLAGRIDRLSLATTGVFEDFEGKPYPF